MMLTAHINLHLRDDTACYATRSAGYVWIKLGDNVTIHIQGENQLAELMGAVDQASKLLVETQSL